MQTSRFEHGVISCLQIIGIGVLLHVGFYVGAKLAKKMKIDTKKEVDKYKGIGISAKKYATTHYGVEEIIF